MIKFVNTEYNWKNLNLKTFLEEGNVPKSWKKFFDKKEIQEKLVKISTQLEKERLDRIYPQINQVFRAFYMTPLHKIKIVLVGMDPYHNGSAVGLCFSVKQGNKINPSLKNIYKELKKDFSVTENGNLEHWAKQGCFMYNMALTVEKGCPDSYTGFWYDFSEEVVKYIAENCEKVVWLLMGRKAQEVLEFVPSNHEVICTSHPSPFSAHRDGKYPAFLGSNAFKKINQILKIWNKKEILW